MIPQIISTWDAREYVTGTKLPRENETSPGIQEVPKDVPNVPFT